MTQPINFDFILFGATGDLSMRKLLPALYQAHAAGLLHPDGRILGSARSRLSTAEFLQKVETDAKIHIKEAYSAQMWASFIARIEYIPVDMQRAEDFAVLAQAVRERSQTEQTVIYLSTSPKFFSAACENLAAAGLNKGVRIVLEKPLGTDLASSRAINAEVARYFDESQVYRIDHYLGKESLQNLLPLRFGNMMFEPIWNREFVESVEITIAEQLGVEERGEFYDQTGALRDMLQNHLLQMLCFTAMERPKSLSADDIRDAKLNVLKSLRPLNEERIAANVIRAQYSAGAGCRAYREENKVAADSQTETFAAIRAHIDNPRWQGVPFYLRTGKRMAEKTAYIVLNFKKLPEIDCCEMPHNQNPFGTRADRLVINLQPCETVRMRLLVKQSGSGLNTVPAEMVLDLGKTAGGRRAEAYELLLREVIDGRLALFNRRDELEAAWAWLTPLLQAWENGVTELHSYPALSWGPEAAAKLTADDGSCWLESQQID